MAKKIRIATVFSGIGAFEQALLKLNIPFEIEFACDNGERKLSKSYDDILEKANMMSFNNEELNRYVGELYNQTGKENWMKQSYIANYFPYMKKGKDDTYCWYEDIRFIDGKQYKNQIDFFVGGSPCQSFSIIGKRAGLEDARGTLFYEYARLVKEIQPKVFIYENVLGMLTHDHGNTWKVIKEIFDTLGYDELKVKRISAIDCGIPQKRERIFVVGIKKKKKEFEFPDPIPLTTKAQNFLERDVDAHYYFGRKGFEFVTNPKYSNRAKINMEIIRTQKANQQFNWNGDFIFQPIYEIGERKDILERAYVGNWKGQEGVIRKMTERECLRLMGFQDDLFKIVVPSMHMYRQAGNSIVVNVLELIIKAIQKAGY